MANSIDYSALPISIAAPSPWKAVRLSIVVTLLIFVLVGPFMYISGINPDSSLRHVPWIIEMIAVPSILVAMYKVLTAKLRRQRRTMSQFAQQNGWEFEGGKRTVITDALPAGWGFTGNSAHQIYRIKGSLQLGSFDLYVFLGFDRTALANQYGSKTLGYRTVIRTHAPISSYRLSEDIQIVRGNATNDREIRAMFQPINRESNSTPSPNSR
jgi:hypothetical protein